LARFDKLNDAFYMVDDSGVQLTLAANVRRLRIARHLSLSELARATAISKATLSSIENARANPTVETLAALAGAMRVSIAELLEELPLGEVRIVRAAQSKVEERGGLPRRSLDALAAGGGIEVTELELDAGQMHEAPPRPAGSRAHVYVLSGKLITGPVERSTELAVGDYAAFPADVPHVFEAGRRPARALLLAQEPS
jgi:transcriptional regulator with XRE-family HTH domain